MTGSFVWVRGFHGQPIPEKWPSDAPSGVKMLAEREAKVVLARHDLSEAEFGLAIAVLEQRYPAPTVIAR